MAWWSFRNVWEPAPNILTYFLANKKQKVVLSFQLFLWVAISAGVSRNSIHGRLRFLIYINDLVDGLHIFIFLAIIKKTVNHCPAQSKMVFNSDPNKGTQELIFSQKSNKILFLPIDFNDKFNFGNKLFFSLTATGFRRRKLQAGFLLIISSQNYYHRKKANFDSFW